MTSKQRFFIKLQVIPYLSRHAYFKIYKTISNPFFSIKYFAWFSLEIMAKLKISPSSYSKILKSLIYKKFKQILMQFSKIKSDSLKFIKFY